MSGFSEWEPWFAWRPVVYPDIVNAERRVRWAWLRIVRRRRFHQDGQHSWVYDGRRTR